MNDETIRMSAVPKRRERRWRAQIGLASLLVIVGAVAVFFACKRAQYVALEKQRIVLKDLKDFGPVATWNSDGVRSLEFQPAPRMLDDQHLARLGDLPELWAVNLRETQITDQGLQQLVSLTNVRWVMLPRVGITDRGIRDFEAQRPDVNVVRFPQ
jgi:hypothetical protein